MRPSRVVRLIQAEPQQKHPIPAKCAERPVGGRPQGSREGSVTRGKAGGLCAEGKGPRHAGEQNTPTKTQSRIVVSTGKPSSGTLKMRGAEGSSKAPGESRAGKTPVVSARPCARKRRRDEGSLAAPDQTRGGRRGISTTPAADGDRGHTPAGTTVPGRRGDDPCQERTQSRAWVRTTALDARERRQPWRTQGPRWPRSRPERRSA